MFNGGVGKSDRNNIFSHRGHADKHLRLLFWLITVPQQSQAQIARGGGGRARREEQGHRSGHWTLSPPVPWAALLAMPPPHPAGGNGAHGGAWPANGGGAAWPQPRSGWEGGGGREGGAGPEGGGWGQMQASVPDHRPSFLRGNWIIV